MSHSFVAALDVVCQFTGRRWRANRRPGHRGLRLCELLLRSVVVFLLTAASSGFSSLPAQDPALNRNEFTRQLYLYSELPKKEAISQADAHFKNVLNDLLSELPTSRDSILKFQLKDIERDVARTARRYREHKVEE